MCSCPTTFQHSRGPCTGGMSEKSGRGVSFETVRIIDLGIADDADGAAIDVVQKDEGLSFSLAGSASVALLLLDPDCNRRDKTQIEPFWYYVASPNPWLPMA